MMMVGGLMMLVFLGIVGFAFGLPLAITAGIWMWPGWRANRFAALSGLAGSAIGIGLCAVLFVLPLAAVGLLMNDARQGPPSWMAMIATACVFGVMAGLPALSVLGYIVGFFRSHNRRRRAEATAPGSVFAP